MNCIDAREKSHDSISAVPTLFVRALSGEAELKVCCFCFVLSRYAWGVFGWRGTERWRRQNPFAAHEMIVLPSLHRIPRVRSVDVKFVCSRGFKHSSLTAEDEHSRAEESGRSVAVRDENSNYKSGTEKKKKRGLHFVFSFRRSIVSVSVKPQFCADSSLKCIMLVSVPLLLTPPSWSLRRVLAPSRLCPEMLLLS